MIPDKDEEYNRSRGKCSFNKDQWCAVKEKTRSKGVLGVLKSSSMLC